MAAREPIEPNDLTSILNGDVAASSADEAALYGELRALISTVVSRDPGGLRGVGTGANLTHVVHEAWLRLQSTHRWASRAHFFGAASRAARQVLVDEARKRRVRAADRTGPATAPSTPAGNDRRTLEIDEALDRLAAADPRAAHVASLKLFGDLDTATIAEIASVSTKTVQRDWAFARAFLAAELGPE